MTGKDERLTFDPGFLRNEFLGDRRWHPPFTRQPTISWEEIASQGLSRGDLEVTMVDVRSCFLESEPSRCGFVNQIPVFMGKPHRTLTLPPSAYNFPLSSTHGSFSGSKERP